MCSCHVGIVGTLKFVMSQADRAIYCILAQQIRTANVHDSYNDSALGNQINDGSGLYCKKNRAVIDFDIIPARTVSDRRKQTLIERKTTSWLRLQFMRK